MKKSVKAQNEFKSKLAESTKNIKWTVFNRGTPEGDAQREAFKKRYGVNPEQL